MARKGYGLKALREERLRMPSDMRKAVDRLVTKYGPSGDHTTRLILLESIDVVVRAVVCKEKCCSGLTRKERLSQV